MRKKKNNRVRSDNTVLTAKVKKNKSIITKKKMVFSLLDIFDAGSFRHVYTQMFCIWMMSRAPTHCTLETITSFF